MLAVAGRFGTYGDAGGNPLVEPLADGGYHVDYDRTLAGPNAWSLGPPDGVIAIDEVFWSVYQFAHFCL